MITITNKQTEALVDLRDGLSSQESAEKRGVRKPTIWARRAALFRYLGARNGPHAVWRAVELGVLRPEVRT